MLCNGINEPPDNKMACAPSLIRAFAVHSMGSHKDPNFLHADSKDYDQTGRMPRLI